jgi:hypothetical protein
MIAQPRMNPTYRGRPLTTPVIPLCQLDPDAFCRTHRGTHLDPQIAVLSRADMLSVLDLVVTGDREVAFHAGPAPVRIEFRETGRELELQLPGSRAGRPPAICAPAGCTGRRRSGPT